MSTIVFCFPFFLFVIVLSVLFQITVSDYFFGVFNLFFNMGALEKYAFVKQLRISVFRFLQRSNS